VIAQDVDAWDRAAAEAGLTHGLRAAQRAVLQALGRGDVLALLPTGAGKSVCYWLPALVGMPTLVISPLRSLMSDQLAHLPRSLRPAARFVHAAQSPPDRREAWSAWNGGRARLLYLAPEGLPAAAAELQAHPPQLVAVDEAHCAVTWGAEFRPAYSGLRALRAGWPATWLALTASSDRATAEAIVRTLGLDHAAVVRQEGDRPEIAWVVVGDEPRAARLERLRALAQAGAGLLYASRRAQVGPLAQRLADAGCGHVATYHAAMAASARAAVERAWVAHSCDLVVATVAFGLGVDRADVRWVAHWEPPRRWDELWQQAGRAGRDGRPATALTWRVESLWQDAVVRRYLHASGCRRAVLRTALAAGWDRPWRWGPAVGVAAPPRPRLPCCDRCAAGEQVRAA
jgi:ATP-dependent DNA helicase RecQ